MTKRMGFFTGIVAALALTGCTSRQSAADAPRAAAPAAAPAPIVAGTVAENTATVTAVVEAVDLKKRVVTLRGPDGRTLKVQADQRVRNLDQVKKGDEVVATYYEALMYEVVKPGQGAPGVAVASDVATAKPGEKPAGVAAEATTVTATISAIDSKRETVTLTGPDGEQRTIKVRDPSKLEKVQVGDLVEITYTEALAIAVEPAQKK